MKPDIPREVQATADRLSRAWDLEIGSRLSGATCSLVLEVGDSQVLKIPFPDAEEARAWNVVQAFSGHGGVALLRYDPESGAMLMPRLLPGTNLAESNLSDLERVDVCADLILRLRQCPQVEGVPLKRWYRELEEMPRSELVNNARSAYRDVAVLETPSFLLHGDLHHSNILRDGDEWAVIDPKGLTGDPSFEVVGFMRNPIGETPDAAGMRARLERFARRLDDEYERLWSWAFTQTVMCITSPSSFGNSCEQAARAIWEARPRR